MSNYKDPQDKTAAYLARDGKWFKMDKESVRKVCGRPRLRNTSKLAFFALQPYFHDGNGLLIEPLEHVAVDLGSTKDKLSEDIDILVAAGIIRRTQAGLLYDPVSYKLITKNEEPPDAKFCKISQDSAKFGENLHSPLGQIAPLDKIRASFSDASNAASEKRSDLNPDQNEEDRKSREGSLGVASRFSALKLKVIEEVRAANSTLDWLDVCAKFISANEKTQPGRINRKWFETFVAGYAKRQGAAAAASPGPANEEAEAIRIAKLPKLEREWREPKTKMHEGEYVWSIGGREICHKNFKIDQWDFLDLCRNMSPKNAEVEVHNFLRQLVGVEINTADVLDVFDGMLFTLDQNEQWRGSEYETEDETEQRLQEEKELKKKEEQVRLAIQEKERQEELERQEAERIRKEQEEAERQERERLEAIRKGEEAARRAEERRKRDEEEAKEYAEFKEEFKCVISLLTNKNETTQNHVLKRIQNERMWSKLKARPNNRELLLNEINGYAKILGEGKADEIVAVIEANGLNWWDKNEDQKKLAGKRIAALEEKTVENGCTEGEASVAAEKVAELKEKYGYSTAKRIDIDSDLSVYDYNAYLSVKDRSFKGVLEAVDHIRQSVSRQRQVELTSDAAWRLFHRQREKNNLREAFGGKLEGKEYEAAIS